RSPRAAAPRGAGMRTRRHPAGRPRAGPRGRLDLPPGLSCSSLPPRALPHRFNGSAPGGRDLSRRPPAPRGEKGTPDPNGAGARRGAFRPRRVRQSRRPAAPAPEMPRRVLVIVLWIAVPAVWLLLGCGDEPSSPRATVASATREQVRVQRVVDGDTIK